MVKWVWDIDEKICINVAAIKYLEIMEFFKEIDHKAGYGLSAELDDFAIKIAESPDIGILKDKIRTIIAGD